MERICRWSCRFAPTPGRSATTSTPCSRSSAAGPTPESCRICGEPIAPAASSTSRRARNVCRARVREPHDDAGRARARRRVYRSCTPLDERAGADRQIRPLQHRPQERLGRAPAHAAPLIHLKIGVAEIVAAIELRDLRDAALLGRVAPRVEDLPAHAPLLDAQLAAAAMELIGAVLVVFGAFEHRQHVVPRPAAQALARPSGRSRPSGRACRSSR